MQYYYFANDKSLAQMTEYRTGQFFSGVALFQFYIYGGMVFTFLNVSIYGMEIKVS